MGKNKQSELEAELESTINSIKRAECGEARPAQESAGAFAPRQPAGQENAKKGPPSNHYNQAKLLKYAKDQVERRGLKNLVINADAGDTFIQMAGARCGTKGEIKKALREATIKRAFRP